ncbi:hypothetical protein ASPZODRAFT_136806 [Penicilliopsis zonata CBS 506.65]|uniref:Rho-GAP domain-containing protein n=1 Tax=Penicilliopsis zonata CBS 506.65 TaxID=1073090 RepID=A0A1L9S716_9EURO|nr:hypothetical protein ASPZODRAFT_136806 [Penicilliopsis zonata CBS 506.65]OJJ42944.1 hypothetical protein ASPZODRAFT_136806 [Penicilliopsis zonata CBS 506.65]
MPGFADSFWTPDYATGLGVLYGKLQQGVVENKQILTIAAVRADAEEVYGLRLGDIAPAVDRMTTGFTKDDGASIRKAYEGVRTEMVEASKKHQKIASNIRELVVSPFSRWCDQHEARIQNSHDDLQARIKEHTKQVDLTKKLRSHYFNKCRVVEDLEEENKLAFQSPETSPKVHSTPKIVLPEPVQEEGEEEEPVEIGDYCYAPEELKKLLIHMLDNIKMREVKVPIIGTYQNTSTGADIVEYTQKHMNASSVSYAERIGQDLVDSGFLRLVGNMGSTFANSSKMNYQWRPRVFQLSGIPEKKKPLMRVTSMASSEDGNESPISSVSEILAGWNPLNNPYPNETPADKLRRESREADDRYKAAVKKLDFIRCKLEEEIIENLRFMEQCELDRLKAIKAVVLDFSGAISNVIPSLQSTVDHMMLYQETIQPLGDLRYLLENYRTGGFVPRVQPYENYYGSVEEQNFGVDIEARARADRKRVPILVTTMLTFLDNHYPELEGDEARRAIWLYDVPLAATHRLRHALNNSKVEYREVLEKFEIPVIASVLKLYFLELPDSLVSSQVYEIVKTIYSTTAHETTEEGRIKVLQSTLGQLRLNNIATLDAIMTHFTRLIDLTSADEEYVAGLAQNLAPCILRPRVESSLTMNERHSYRLIRDLFAHKDEIFGELKRQSTSLGLAPVANNRPRAISTDESNRRAAMEARNRAIMDRSRANSPAPPRKHRRDRSSGPSEAGRFPILVSSPRTAGTVIRNSLEVPGGSGVSSTETPSSSTNTSATPSAAEQSAPAAADPAVQAESVPDRSSTDSPGSVTSNGSTATPPPLGDALDESPVFTATPAPPINDTVETLVEKRNSLTRSGARMPRKPGMGSRSGFPVIPSTPASSALAGTNSNRNSLAESEPKGVTLEDKPMDD